MHDRCYNTNGKDYEHYGLRGIQICDEWLKDFMEFYNWASHNGYADNLTIDRINVNKGYEPSNCRWTTVAIQNKNKTTAIKVIYKNKEWILKDLVDIKGLTKDYDTIKQRIVNRGYNVEDALTKPIKHKIVKKNIFINALKQEFENKVHNSITKDDFCKKYKINKNSMYDRLKRNDIKDLLKQLNININDKGDLYYE